MKHLQVGDLVRYNQIRQLGIVTRVMTNQASNRSVCAVLWVDGVESTHSDKWLIKVKTSEDR